MGLVLYGLYCWIFSFSFDMFYVLIILFYLSSVIVIMFMIVFYIQCIYYAILHLSY